MPMIFPELEHVAQKPMVTPRVRLSVQDPIVAMKQGKSTDWIRPTPVNKMQKVTPFVAISLGWTFQKINPISANIQA